LLISTRDATPSAELGRARVAMTLGGNGETFGPRGGLLSTSLGRSSALVTVFESRVLPAGGCFGTVVVPEVAAAAAAAAAAATAAVAADEDDVRRLAVALTFFESGPAAFAGLRFACGALDTAAAAAAATARPRARVC